MSFTPMRIHSTREIVYTYQEYLKSRYWQSRKVRFANNHERVCGLCSEQREDLHVHHLSYKHIGNERDEELIYLCPGCHMTIHKCSKAEVSRIKFKRVSNSVGKKHKWYKERKKRRR